jgi:hypothetical protein
MNTVVYSVPDKWMEAAFESIYNTSESSIVLVDKLLSVGQT